MALIMALQFSRTKAIVSRTVDKFRNVIMRNNCANSHIVNNDKGIMLTSLLLKFGIFVYMSPTFSSMALPKRN